MNLKIEIIINEDGLQCIPNSFDGNGVNKNAFGFQEAVVAFGAFETLAKEYKARIIDTIKTNDECDDMEAEAKLKLIQLDIGYFNKEGKENG